MACLGISDEIEDATIAIDEMTMSQIKAMICKLQFVTFRQSSQTCIRKIIFEMTAMRMEWLFSSIYVKSMLSWKTILDIKTTISFKNKQHGFLFPHPTCNITKIFSD